MFNTSVVTVNPTKCSIGISSKIREQEMGECYTTTTCILIEVAGYVSSHYMPVSHMFIFIECVISDFLNSVVSVVRLH